MKWTFNFIKLLCKIQKCAINVKMSAKTYEENWRNISDARTLQNKQRNKHNHYKIKQSELWGPLKEFLHKAVPKWGKMGERKSII